jgi:SNF2 family DNA or RNA helicase
MNELAPIIPSFIIKEGEKYFSQNTVKKGLSLFQFAKLSISFLKEGPNYEYFIISGIIKENKNHEVKVVFKKRLENHLTGPLKTQCSCGSWTKVSHCQHTSFLFLYYVSYIKRKKPSSVLSDHDPLPYLSLPNNQVEAVYPEKFGTIINNPKYLIGAPQNSKYTNLQYSLSKGRMTHFPEPFSFKGRLIVAISDQGDNPGVINYSFLYKSDSNIINKKISLFEHFFLFNWVNGEVYNLPFEIKSVLQNLKFWPVTPSTNDLLEIFKEKSLTNYLEVWINGTPIEQIDTEEIFPTIVVERSKNKNYLNLSLSFSHKNKIIPPEFLKMMTSQNNQIFFDLNKKLNPYELIISIKNFFKDGSPHYRKLLSRTIFKTLLIQKTNFLKEHKWSYLFHDKNLFKVKNAFIMDFFTSLVVIFSEKTFQYSNFDPEKNEISYTIKENLFMEGIPSFYKDLSKYKLEIFYNKTPLQYWKSDFKTSRIKDESNWFTLELSISKDELKIIKSLDNKKDLFLNKNQLVLLTDDQKKLLKYLKRYTLFESQFIDEKSSEDVNTFLIPFSRSRIFEILELKKMGINIDLSDKEKELCEFLLDPQKIPPYKIPENLRNVLRAYQKKGYNWLRYLYENNLGGCLADDMGLGKTLQTITFLDSIIHKVKKVLIICPISILINWEKEVQKFSSLSIHIFHGEKRNIPEDKKIILTSYGILKREFNDYLKNFSFDILILDEVQQVKNIKSLGAFAVRKLKTNFRVCLTGTPVENNITEFYNIIDLCMPGIWGDLLSASSQSTKKSRLIAKEVASPFILRRTKNQVLLDLPKKIENNVFLNFSKTEQNYYEHLKTTIKKDLLSTTTQKKFGMILTSILKLRQCCLWGSQLKETQSTKAHFLIDSLSQIIEEGHKSLVFSQFTSYLDYIESFIKKKGWTYSRIDGTQPFKKRHQELENFQAGKSDVFLISLKAGGFGINLTAASFVFLMDPWWNPAIENQAIDRAHRIGQKNTLTIYKPIIKNSIEEKVLSLQETKRELFKDLLPDDSEQYFSNKMTLNDLEHLLN